MHNDIKAISSNDLEKISSLFNDIQSSFMSCYDKNDVMTSWFVDSNVPDQDSRNAVGIERNNDLVFAMGGRSIGFFPAWEISWVISRNISDYQWRLLFFHHLQRLSSHFLEKNEKEFYIRLPSPLSETFGNSLCSKLYPTYYSFFEKRIMANTRPMYPIHWMLMGNRLQPIDIDIIRFIKKAKS